MVLKDNITKWSSLTDLHGENAQYVMENYGSKIIVYISIVLSYINMYFLTYMFFKKEKVFVKRFICYLVFIMAMVISLTSNSRASVINLFIPLGLISFYLFLLFLVTV